MDLLKRLMELPGPSGDEWRVRELIKKEITPYVDEVYTDKFGNLIAHRKGKGAKVMLVAHMDEIGLMVKALIISASVVLKLAALRQSHY